MVVMAEQTQETIEDQVAAVPVVIQVTEVQALHQLQVEVLLLVQVALAAAAEAAVKAVKLKPAAVAVEA